MSDAVSLVQDPANSHVLIVDDVAKNLQVVGTMLRNEGYEVMPAISGAQALERVQAEPPHLILLDLMMPEMDGLEVCRRLKADTATAQIPVIFLTASNEMEHLVSGFSVGAVDYITKPFNAPELLARVRTHLELQHARRRLREMNEEKNEFMGIAAHDLRSPLNAINGYAEMLLEDAKLDEESIELVGRIGVASRRMVEMVQNLLDVNAIERGELNLKLQACDLSKIVASVVEAHSGKAALKQQSIESMLPDSVSMVNADPILLVQVIENLISNAVKYSPPERKIFARVGNREDTVRFEVRDEGPGLSAEDQKKLFGKFARLSAKPTGGENSTGLGLSIVKKMVEAMNGRVWCESEPGNGATFFVELPMV